MTDGCSSVGQTDLVPNSATQNIALHRRKLHCLACIMVSKWVRQTQHKTELYVQWSIICNYLIIQLCFSIISYLLYLYHICFSLSLPYPSPLSQQVVSVQLSLSSHGPSQSYSFLQAVYMVSEGPILSYIINGSPHVHFRLSFANPQLIYSLWCGSLPTYSIMRTKNSKLKFVKRRKISN